jgi:hypothetical protein
MIALASLSESCAEDRFGSIPITPASPGREKTLEGGRSRCWDWMFVRISPYLPFSARVCLNQHHWMANRMRSEGIDFEQCSNAFLKCSHPQKLQELADSLTAHDLLSCGQKWLTCLTPFFRESDRKEAGCQHRLFFSQVEYCDNLIFHRRAALDQLCQRLLDANRTIGQPKKITMIFVTIISRSSRAKSPRLVAVELASKDHDGNNRTLCALEVRRGFDSETLLRVVEVLEETCAKTLASSRAQR